MSRPVSQKVSTEREKGGLIIISAQYGLASAFTDRGVRSTRTVERRTEEGEKMVEEEEEEVVVDVTIPVQALVVDSKLYIPGSRGKHNLLGFWVTYNSPIDERRVRKC
jgi:DnaJ family protein C protein 11